MEMSQDVLSLYGMALAGAALNFLLNVILDTEYHVYIIRPSVQKSTALQLRKKEICYFCFTITLMCAAQPSH